jgi:hypothetical protein
LIGDTSSPDCAEGLISARVMTAAAYQAWAIFNFLQGGTQ